MYTWRTCDGNIAGTGLIVKQIRTLFNGGVGADRTNQAPVSTTVSTFSVLISHYWQCHVVLHFDLTESPLCV